MLQKSVFDIILCRYVTEKTALLGALVDKENNPSVFRCKSPKVVFLVAKQASKVEIAKAVEEIYSGQGIKVLSVNTILMKPKKRRVRGRKGFAAGFKKAVVTLRPGDKIEE